MDGTIIHRRERKLSISERVADMFKTVYSLEDTYSGSSFEGKPLRMRLHDGFYLVTFRRGTYSLLRSLASQGTVVIVTHASQSYAFKIFQFLRKTCDLQLQLICKQRHTLKYVSDAHWILDDQPQRWHKLNRQVITTVNVFFSSDAAHDNELVKVRQTRLLCMLLMPLLMLPESVCAMILEYRGMDALDPLQPLRKCVHCMDVWVLSGRDKCMYCKHHG